MWQLATYDSFPGRDIAAKNLFEKYISWPLKSLKCTSTAPGEWVGPLRQIALQTYKDLNAAIAKYVVSFGALHNKLTSLQTRRQARQATFKRQVSRRHYVTHEQSRSQAHVHLAFPQGTGAYQDHIHTLYRGPPGSNSSHIWEPTGRTSSSEVRD